MLVLALLAIVTAVSAPRMISFFRGRSLSEESRRVLALVHYAQSRAVAEGVPVVLWFSPAASTYGQNIQPGFTTRDDRASSFVLESSLTLEAPVTGAPPVSELGDETLGMTDGLPMIRFTPDGFFDPSSVQKLVIHQGAETALELVPTANHLGYEILPYTAN